MNKYKKIAAWVLLLVSVCIILCLSATIVAPDVRFDSEAVTALDGKWKADSQGKSETVHLPASVDANAGEKVLFSIRMKPQDTYMNAIMVKVLHNYTRLYLDDSLLGEFGYDNKTPFGNAPYAGYLIVRLPDDWQGKTLTIEQTGYYDNYSGILNTVYGGTKNALVYLIFKQCAPVLLMNFSIIILSIFLLIASLFYRWIGIMIQLRAISVFSLITGLWLILESGGYQLFMGHAPLVSNTIFVLFTLMPIAATRFIQTHKKFKNNRLMDILYCLSLANFVIVQILQFTKTADYIETIMGTHLIIVLMVAVVLLEFFRTRIRKEKLEDFQLYLACMVFAAFGFVDILRFYVGNPLSNSVKFTQVGLALFVLVLMFSAISNIVNDRENSLKKDMMQYLAYTDLLTNLPNRNAFEERMEAYRGEQNQRHPVIILADLNYLKKINDKHGHRMGDEAIICTGHILRNVFPESAAVYRIGGDEYCIISDSIELTQAEHCIRICKQKFKEQSEESKVDISASFGMCCDKGQGADAVFIAADKAMYKNKLLDKQQYKACD